MIPFLYVIASIYVKKINLRGCPPNVISGWLFLPVEIMDSLYFHLSLHSNISTMIIYYFYH